MRADRRFRRWFDQVVDRALVRGSLLAAVLLLVGSLIVVLAGSVIIALGHIDIEGSNQSVLEDAWQVLLRAMSPDQLMTNNRWDARIVLLIVTILGLLLVSTLISILNSVLERRMEFIHRGRGAISTSDHLVILNWNQFGVRVVREIAHAAEPGSPPRRVAILCDEDPVHLMHEIRDSLKAEIQPQTSKIHAHFFKHPEKWLTIRRGRATSMADLSNLTSVTTARSVIILRDQDFDPVQALRVVLAIDSVLASEINQTTRKSSLPVVTFTNRNPLATLLDNQLQRIAQTVQHERRYINYIPLSAEDIRHGVEAQVSRHRGLSAVYQDLLNFGGQELYIVDGSKFGQTFGDAVLNAKHSTPLFVIEDGQLNLWPSWDSQISDTKMVVLAETRLDAESGAADSPNSGLATRQMPKYSSIRTERFLFIGWNEDSERLAATLQRILPSGSHLAVIIRPTDTIATPHMFCGEPVQVYELHPSNPLTHPDFLNQIDHVIVFTDQSVDTGTSDTSVLIDLLTCRHHADQISDPGKRFTIVAELQKRSSRYIAGDRLADDLLINDSLLASTAVQLAFAPELERVFASLLSVEEPVELITRHISYWGQLAENATWNDLIQKTVSESGEIPIGYRRIVSKLPAVVLNPERTLLLQQEDEIILLSHRITSAHQVASAVEPKALR